MRAPDEQPGAGAEDKTSFRPLRLVAVILLILLGISTAAQWYGRHVSMPRYCQDPVNIIARVHEVLTKARPAGDGDRKPYIIAARLTFLVPRDSEESVDSYIKRLQQHVDQQCR
ncbi:MAG: hypothetical protein MI754_01550 [Chromatiales bacterium]|nr:hypothetical protein [Chromatiales bacterium]